MVLWQGCGRAVGSWVGRTSKMEALELWHCPATHHGLEARGPRAAFPVSVWPQAHLRSLCGEKWPQAYCFGYGLPCRDAIEHLCAYLIRVSCELTAWQRLNQCLADEQADGQMLALRAVTVF